jgi:hypothetical protein
LQSKRNKNSKKERKKNSRKEMGNSESGNLDNDDSNWFNNDGDSFTSRYTNRRDQDLKNAPNNNDVKYSRSFSALANRVHTPVSMVSPVMKNFQSRSHSVGRASTPVSMVSPIMTPATSRTKGVALRTKKSSSRTSYKNNLVNANTKSSPLVHRSSLQTPPSLNNLNTYYHSSFKTKNPPVVTSIPKNPSSMQTQIQPPPPPSSQHKKETKRSTSVAKPNFLYPQSQENQIQSKRSQSTPRNYVNQQQKYLQQQSQVFIRNYYPNYENNQYAIASPTIPKQPPALAQPSYSQQQLQQQQQKQYSQQPIYQNVPNPRAHSSDMRQRSSQISPVALNRTYLKKLSDTKQASINSNSNKVAKYQVAPQRFYFQQSSMPKNAPSVAQKPVTSSKPQTRNKILVTSSKWKTPDLKMNREFKYSSNLNQSSPTHYNQQYGYVVPPLTSLKNNAGNNSNPEPKNFMNGLDGLQYVDLDAAGLSEYKHFVKNILPKYSSSIQPVVKFYNKLVTPPPNSQMSGNIQFMAKRGSSSSQKHLRAQNSSQQSYMAYYQNPQFLTSNTSMAAQPKISNYPTYDNTMTFNNSNPLFNSVYLSGY